MTGYTERLQSFFFSGSLDAPSFKQTWRTLIIVKLFIRVCFQKLTSVAAEMVSLLYLPVAAFSEHYIFCVFTLSIAL